MKHMIPSLIILGCCICAACTRIPQIDRNSIIDAYAGEFNANDEEIYIQKFPNTEAAAFMKENIPVFECPDAELEKTYYFRWWTYRKHIKEVPSGFIITEFRPDVPWAGLYNAIPCPGAHHFEEGRWLKDTRYLDSYARYWFLDGAAPRAYSFPIAAALLDYASVTGNKDLLFEQYDNLKANYAAWESDHLGPDGLFWQMDDRDGMEFSISGSYSDDWTGYRPTINSYMYADAMAISTIASMLGKAGDEAEYKDKATRIKELMDKYLWDEEDKFYKVIVRNPKPEFAGMRQCPAREETGYIPWVYGIPDEDKSQAWLQLLDTAGFKAPYGPTTAEQRAEGFMHTDPSCCTWNGLSWPYSTCQTITGLANQIRRFGSGNPVTKEDYLETLNIYSNSHRLKREDGRTVCWIDENLDPFTGEWFARNELMANEDYPYYERGKDYNHSTFCDLIISGLVGIQPCIDGSITVEPIVPEGLWDYFCMEGIVCQGNEITVIYDRTGHRYGCGKGFFIFKNGKKVFHSKEYAVKATIRA